MSADPMTQRVNEEIARRHGWEPGSTLENSAIRWLTVWGARAEECRQEYRVGAYHLDFAWPQILDVFYRPSKLASPWWGFWPGPIAARPLPLRWRRGC